MISYYSFSFIWTEKLKRILISCRLPKVSYTLAVYEDLTEMCGFSLDLLRCTKVSLETRSQLRSSQALWLVHFLWEFAVCRLCRGSELFSLGLWLASSHRRAILWLWQECYFLGQLYGLVLKQRTQILIDVHKSKSRIYTVPYTPQMHTTLTTPLPAIRVWAVRVPLHWFSQLCTWGQVTPPDRGSLDSTLSRSDFN